MSERRRTPARYRDKPASGLERNNLVRGGNLTVAIAAKCWWHYAHGGAGWALVAASERMLTTGETQHSLPTIKGGNFGARTYLLASGAIQAHSHIARLMPGEFPGIFDETDMVDGEPDAPPAITCWQLAQHYGDLFKIYRQERAEADILAPLGYTTESFHDKMGNMPEPKAIETLNRLEDYKLPFEALFLGYDERNEPAMLEVDRFGKVTNQDARGFGSIGIGGTHAEAHMMFIGYKPTVNQFEAIWDVFCAKKRAEAAPGVGIETDMIYVNKRGWQHVDPRLTAKLEKLYAAGRQSVDRQRTKAAGELMELTRKLGL